MPIRMSMRVASESRKGLEHVVSLVQDGRRRTWACSCEAFEFNPERECKHILGTKKFANLVRLSLRQAS